MKKAILIMSYGSPESYDFDGVCQFFTNIRRGKRPSDEEVNILLNNYSKINGSPLQEITKKEVELLQERLGADYKVYFANKFSSPFIPDVIQKMENDYIEKCLCLILEPHYSYYSIMGYERFIKSSKIKFNIIKDWYNEPSLINFWVDEIKKIIDDFNDESYKIIFSGHSVPEIALKYNDPYVDQIHDMTKLIVDKLEINKKHYTNTWQSESDIGMPWLKPDVLEYLREQTTHPEHYIFIPLSFISEHIEVLFDNDIECKELCEEFGVKYHRPPMPNYDSRLIDALISTIKKHEDGEYSLHTPEKTTFDEFGRDGNMPDFVKEMIKSKKQENRKHSNLDGAPDFVKETLAKNGGKAEMPDFVKKMLKNKENNQ